MVEQCSICGKKVQEISGGMFSGSSLMDILENTPYPCQACGKVFCQDCMVKIKKYPCKFCGKPLGW